VVGRLVVSISLFLSFACACSSGNGSKSNPSPAPITKKPKVGDNFDPAPDFENIIELSVNSFAQAIVAGEKLFFTLVTNEENSATASRMLSSVDGQNWESSTYADHTVYTTRLVKDSGGNIYMFQMDYAPGGGNSVFRTQKSTDNAETWSDIDFNFPGDEITYVADAYFGENFWLVAANRWIDGESMWLVFKSIDHGATWTKVDQINPEMETNGTSPTKILVTDSAIFIGGAYWDSKTSMYWRLRRSLDGGTTWETVDQWRNEARAYTYIHALSKNSDGSISSIGTAGRSDGLIDWVTRRSSNNGMSWSLTNLSTSPTYQEMTSVLVSDDKIYACGYLYDPVTRIYISLVRVTEDGGTSWISFPTTDNFKCLGLIEFNSEIIYFDRDQNTGWLYPKNLP